MRRLLPLCAIWLATPSYAEQAADGRPSIGATRELVAITARIRGLRRRRAVKMGVLTRAEILARIKRRLAQDYSDAEIAVDAAVLKRLGLLDRKADYKKEVLTLLTDQIAGFYDPRSRQLNIAAWLPLVMQRPALVHEICHALQDQHFGLKRFVQPIKDNSDRQLARASMVEGDCMGVMIEHLLAPTGRDLGSVGPLIDKLAQQVISGNTSAEFRAAPRHLRETLTFPYLYGLRFIQRLRMRHGWSRVNRMFRRPPDSTEQVMHYEKYWRRERPQRIRVGALPQLAALRLIKQDTLGEFQLRLHVVEKTGKQKAVRAAAGWEGDRLAAYRRPESDGLPLIVHLSTWDTAADALEFAEAERLVIAGLAPRPLTSPYADLWIRLDGDGLEWSVQLQDRHVLLLMAAPPALRAQLQREVWRRWRIARKRVRPKLVPRPRTAPQR